ncbi:metallophosphoesterase [Dehalococcoidia bacterium]|nr:metallophosphoesterase [Dehalococcoidia bacterium]
MHNTLVSVSSIVWCVDVLPDITESERLLTAKNRDHLRILHMSDVHVGSDAYPDEALQGLGEAIFLAHHVGVDAVLVAGDLFDNHQVSHAMVDWVMDAFATLDRPVVVLPGNHDTVITQEIWTGESTDNISILRKAKGEMLLFDDLGLAVWGRPVYDHHPGFRPLANMPLRPWDGWYVSMAHGLVTYPSESLWRSSPILPEEIASADCDYIALGHVHVFRDVSQNGVPAFYSGAPSGVLACGVAIVELDPVNGVSVVPRSIVVTSADRERKT